MTWRIEKEETSYSKACLVFENDPGRRNRSIVGERHLRNILSMHVISEELLLVRFGRGCADRDSYWTLLTFNGQTVELSHDLR